jgi:FkbM family methyltransferase
MPCSPLTTISVKKTFGCPSVASAQSFSRNITAFFSDFGGDESRYSFHSYLTDRSTVVEIGGYTGVDIKAMKARYGDFRVVLFEPIFYEEARHNLEHLNKVEILPYGVGSSESKIYFVVAGDATRPGDESSGKVGFIRKFTDVLSELQLLSVDLLQINCEGCEWDVLESVFGDVWRLKRIQVQFHPDADFVPDRLGRYAKIQDRLAETHDLVYDFPWIWQMWELKGV